MERFVNELSAKLINKFSLKDLIVIREAIYSVLNEYDVVPKKNELVVANNTCPRELNIYLAMKKLEGTMDSSLKIYKAELTKMLCFINKPLNEIAADDLRFYFYSIQSQNKLDTVTLNNKRLYINSFFSWLINNGYISKNPCAVIAPFKKRKVSKMPLSDLEMEKIRIACKNSYERAVIEVLYSTACRVSELTDIRFEDIDFDKKEIYIRHGKGDKPRTTFLNAKSLVAIQEYIKGRDYPTEYLFETSRKPHHKMSSRNIEKTCKSLEQRTGIKLHPHKIRRTTATDLLKKGVPIEKIKELLGHESLETTLIYAKVDTDSVKAEHQKYM